MHDTVPSYRGEQRLIFRPLVKLIHRCADWDAVAAGLTYGIHKYLEASAFRRIVLVFYLTRANSVTGIEIDVAAQSGLACATGELESIKVLGKIALLVEWFKRT